MSSLTKKSVNTKSASGIGLAPSLTTAFQSAKSSRTVRAIKVEIKNDTALYDSQSLSRSGGWSSDFNRISSSFLSDEKSCCFVICFKDNGSVLLASYVPGGASLKDKMVYSTSKGALLGLVGMEAEQYAATSKSEFSYDSYSKHSSVKAPLSLLEEQMKEHDAASAPLKHEPAKKNAAYSLIAKMAAGSKTGGYAGAPAKAVVSNLPTPDAVASALANPTVPTTTTTTTTASTKSKWGGGTQPTAGKCGMAGCPHPRLGRGYCASHASFANGGPTPAPGIKKQTTTTTTTSSTSGLDTKSAAAAPTTAAVAAPSTAAAAATDAPGAPAAPAPATTTTAAGDAPKADAAKSDAAKPAAPAFGAFGAPVVIGGGGAASK